MTIRFNFLKLLFTKIVDYLPNSNIKRNNGEDFFKKCETMLSKVINAMARLSKDCLIILQNNHNTVFLIKLISVQEILG